MHILKSNISKVFIVSLIYLVLLFFGYTAVASAQTVLFTRNLSWNTYGQTADVKLLQQFLASEGLYNGPISGTYLSLTYQAVVDFQTREGILPASGYFGTATRLRANEIITAKGFIPTISTVSTSAVIAPITASVIQATTSGNLIYNPSMEEANGTKPNKWLATNWGTNTSTFTYHTNGFDGSKSVGLTITSYTSGDAKWYFEDVLVTPGKQYTFSEYYKSNVVSNLTIRWTKTDGTKSYQWLADPAVSSNWTLSTSNFTVPAGVKSMTIFHLLKRNGTLQVDNYKLSLTGTINSTTTTPVDAVVSAWSGWIATTAWSTCLNNSQSRTEERTRTVISPAINGGITPVLKESRGVAQSCTVSTSPTPTPTTGSGLNFDKKEWGAYVGWQEGAMDIFEDLVGKDAKYRAVFIHWGNERKFPTYLKPYVMDQGKSLMIFWEATDYNVGTVNQTNYSYDSVINGNWDTYFAEFARDAKAYGGEVILIPYSEMNGDWFPWSITKNGNTPQKHIDAWRKIRGFFNDVPNVKFGWAPNHDSVPDITDNQFEKFYPGDAYVDYVGLDGFNFGSPWMTFDQVFGSSLARMKVYKKPMFIFSFASAAGASKALWITDALTIQIPKYPEIKGWIWFNENKERDWRVTADTSVLNAFKVSLP
jgi:hypothetical protein